jgi:hypothetical protein
MEVLYDIQEMMDSIMRMMDDGSHYDEFEPEFVAIDNLIKSLESHHTVCQASEEMFRSLSESNGFLERSYTEMRAFQRTIDMTINSLD